VLDFLSLWTDSLFPRKANPSVGCSVAIAVAFCIKANPSSLLIVFMDAKHLHDGFERRSQAFEGWFRLIFSGAIPLFSFSEEIFKKYLAQIMKD
jgi:hypothetical protein